LNTEKTEACLENWSHPRNPAANNHTTQGADGDPLTPSAELQ